MSPLENEESPTGQVFAPENIVKGTNDVLGNKKAVSVLAKKGVETAVPYVEKLRNTDTVTNMDEFISKMSPENRRKFLEIALNTSLDSTMWERFKDSVSFAFPPWKLKRTYDSINNGTYAALLLMGAIGNRLDQEYVATRVTPGFIERHLVTALKLIALWDPELVSKGFIATVTAAIGTKGLALEILRGTRMEIAKQPRQANVDTTVKTERIEIDEATTPPGVIEKAA